MMKSKFMTIALCASLSLLTACARQISPDVYSDSSVGQVSRGVPGVIISAREVQVAGKDRTDQNTAGLIGGGAAGALLGSTIGGGTGRIAASVAGAAAGAFAGALAQGELEKQVGIEYMVETENREIMSVVQGPEPRYQAGQRVFIVMNHNGRSRIVPDHGRSPIAPRNKMQGVYQQPPMGHGYNGYSGY